MNADWQQLSALVIGFGSIGRRHARILREIGLDDVRVCDPAVELLEWARREFGIRRTFEAQEAGLESMPDSVFICTPTALHVEQALRSIRAGAHVFAEKPLSTSAEGVAELEAAARDLGRTVMVGHCFRFHEGLRKAKEWLDEGRIGRLISVRAVMGEYIPDVMPNYRSMYISKYNGAYELMHDIDLALWFAGRPPVSVFGIDGTFGDMGMESPDTVELLIRFEDRCVANVHLDFFQRVRHRQTELFGTEGTITVEFADWNACQLSLYEARVGEWHCEQLWTDRDDMFRDEDRAFLRAVSAGTAVPVTVADGLLAVRVMNAAQESARSGRSVELEVDR